MFQGQQVVVKLFSILLPSSVIFIVASECIQTRHHTQPQCNRTTVLYLPLFTLNLIRPTHYSDVSSPAYPAHSNNPPPRQRRRSHSKGLCLLETQAHIARRLDQPASAAKLYPARSCLPLACRNPKHLPPSPAKRHDSSCCAFPRLRQTDLPPPRKPEFA